MISVKDIAKLANLTLTDQELKLYSEQFKAILGYIDQLSKVNTKDVEPTFQTIDNTTNILREDKAKPGLTQKQALSAASKTHQGYFVADHVFDSKILKEKTTHTPRKKLDKLGAILTKVDPKGTVGHKDLFCTKGIETTAGSHVLSGYVPQYSATIVKQLEGLGLKTKYKLNQDAWGHGSSGENSDFFPTKNPWDKKRVAGGSSSGSAAAVAAGDIDLATGTDTGCSIRTPASFTNTTGIKTTYGAFSRYGVVAFASSLDCPGLMTTSARKLKRYYLKLAKKDVFDATTCSNKRSRLNQKQQIKSLGLPEQYFDKAVDPKVKKLVTQAAKLLEKNGIELKSVSLPHTKYGIAAYYIIAFVETASNLGRYDGVRFGNDRTNFGPEAKRRIVLGTFASSAGYADKYYEQAAKVRTLIINDFKKAFEQVDAIIAPVCPSTAFKIGEKIDDPLQMYLSDVLTVPINLAGIPALSIPCGFVDNLPVGLQLIGPRWSDIKLLELAEEYQQLTNYHLQTPNL
jgi:aspartyl-tRNA(Asn)/glutamyl-tRNA(Gln) amidotransferase subunit A